MVETTKIGNKTLVMDGKTLSLFRKGILLRQMYYGGYINEMGTVIRTSSLYLFPSPTEVEVETTALDVKTSTIFIFPQVEEVNVEQTASVKTMEIQLS
ncbi:MAG: hypothetical protein ACTSYJ_04985 [Candidatus Thorarchaeota archaeon]